jgi:hypothetical protein
MPLTIFFSWQADAPPREGGNLIERALERAIGRIADDLTIEEAVRELEVDRDTKGVPGSPPIMDTIFRKIDNAAVFVPDITFVGTRLDGRPIPNPNVLIEYGWALKSVTHFRIVPVMNTAFGKPTRDAMPFDLGSFRNPITYECAATFDEEDRKRARDSLSKKLESAIRDVVRSEEFKDRLPKPPAPVEFLARPPVDGPARFKHRDEPIGVYSHVYGHGQELRLSRQPAVWFRMMPLVKPNRAWSPSDLQAIATQTGFLPLFADYSSGYSSLHSHEGFCIFSVLDKQHENTNAIVFIFTTGEIWAIDAALLDTMKREGIIPPIEKYVRRAMRAYGTFLATKLGIDPPFKWIVGMEDIKGRSLYVPPPSNRTSFLPGPRGKCQLETIEGDGLYSPGESEAEILKPFFTKLYDSCGVSRPEWLDT